MKDLLLVDGDFVFDGRDLQLVSGVDEIKQTVANNLRTRKEEFSLDENIGLDRTYLLGKDFDEEIGRADIVEAICQDERVQQVDEIDFTKDSHKRNVAATVSFTALDGTKVSIEQVIIDGS